MLIYECTTCYRRFRSRLDFQDHSILTDHKAVEVYDASKLPERE